MSHNIETVKVVADTPFGYATINAVDYDAATQVLYSEAQELAPQGEKSDEPVERKRRRRAE